MLIWVHFEVGCITLAAGRKVHCQQVFISQQVAHINALVILCIYVDADYT